MNLLMCALHMLDRMIQRRLPSVSLSMSEAQIREFAWLTGGQLATLLLSLVTVKIITSVGPDGYGKFILATSIGGMLSMSFFGPLEQGYIRMYFYYGSGSQTRKVYFDSLLAILGGATGVFLLVATVVVGTGHAVWGWDLAFHTAAVLMILIAVLTVPVNGMMNAMRMRKQVSIIQIVERGVMILALATVVLFTSLTVIGVVLCTSFATGVSLLVRYRIYRRSATELPDNPGDTAHPGPSALRREIFTKVITYSSPFIAWGLISWVQSNGERWIIDSVMTKADVGRYGLASSLVNSSVVLVVSVLGQFVTPIIFAKFSSPSTEERRRGMYLIRLNTWAVGAFFTGFALILYLFGEDIVRLVSTRAFTIDGVILLLLTMGLGMYHSAQAMTTVGLAMNTPGIYLPAKVVGAIMSVLLYYVGCLWYGLLGIVGALVVVNLVYLVMVQAANRTLLRTKDQEALSPS